MAQAGLHSLVGVAVRKWVPNREWTMLGIVLGSLFPDADNLAVAVATVAKWSTVGLHRTFTHSLLTVALIVGVFYAIAQVSQQKRWGNLGLGLGVGMLLHIVLDVFVWFSGVVILWPLPYEVNLWQKVTPPQWFMQLMMPVEFLCFALFFWFLGEVAKKRGTDRSFAKKLQVWTAVQLLLFLVLTVWVYALKSGFMTVYGLVYLLSLGLAFGITLRMRQTVEAIAV